MARKFGPPAIILFVLSIARQRVCDTITKRILGVGAAWVHR